MKAKKKGKKKDEDELRRADKDDTKKKKSGRAILSLALYRTLSSPNWIPRPSSLLPVKMRFRRIRREFPERFKSLERGCSSKQSVSRYCMACTVQYMVSYNFFRRETTDICGYIYILRQKDAFATPLTSSCMVFCP